MDLAHWVIIPIAFGLLGFIEPCSVGVNLIFLSYMNRLENRYTAFAENIGHLMRIGINSQAGGTAAQDSPSHQGRRRSGGFYR
jgi:hypothetical protein